MQAANVNTDIGQSSHSNYSQQKPGDAEGDK